MSKVSVIIPNYNRADMVLETIKNQQAQTIPPHEIIVVDDGSTDGSPEVIRKYAPKVTLLEQENQGPGAARNWGFEHATGDYIQFMDSDDLASLNKLECQVRAIESTDSDFAYCPWLHIRWDDQTSAKPLYTLQCKPPGKKYSLFEWKLRGWVQVFQNCVFNRKILEKTGTIRTDLRVGEDGEYFARLLANSPRAVFTPECLVFYRHHMAEKLSESGTSERRKVLDLQTVEKCVEETVNRSKFEPSRSTVFIRNFNYWETASSELMKGKDKFSARQNFIIFPAYKVFLRTTRKLKSLLLKHRWPSFLHARKPTHQHLYLMSEAGIK